jgi:hypothetical protein
MRAAALRHARQLASILLITACQAVRELEPPLAATLEPLPDGHPPLAELPDPELTQGHVGRAPRRLAVRQLAASIETTTGRQWSELEALAGSLGRADYALVNAEAAEPNLVFAKFLEDGVREVCLATAEADLSEPDASRRILSPEVPADISDLTQVGDDSARKNLQYLALRFWGLSLGEDELAVWLASWKRIAARAEAADKKREAWGALCIAFMTDPRFFTY